MNQAAAEAASSTAVRPRLRTLEDVLKILKMRIEHGDARQLAAALWPLLLGDPRLLRDAIAAAWADGSGAEICATCESLPRRSP